MEWLKKAWRGFTAQAHALGAIYYAWAILSTLVTTAYSLYKQLSTPQIQGQSEWFFWVFIVGIGVALLVLPVLGAAVIRSATSKGSDQLANPTLAIAKREVTYRITPTSVLKQQVMTLEALEKTPSFRFHLSVTGIAKSTVILTSIGATLLNPVQKGAADSYEIQFATPLEKGQLTTISFDVMVDDPSKSMRCYAADSFHNAVRYGSFSSKYIFEPRPSSITRDRLNVVGETLESNNQLHSRPLEGGCEYSFSVAKVDPNTVYSVSWVW